jgi:type I restriction enzyme M protein
MLDIETRRRIDSARDILVGKVPDPKAQVEQITTALVYKFMDDMDKASIELGGKAQFFKNGYGQYAWSKLMDSRLGGHERLALYGEAITKLSENPNIPQLFRNIFKDAFLPYRDPETLNLFLKEINGFVYDHSERLGDAYEYLLSILGSQGDAGQFRTPRHIIDFIVKVVDPDKHDTILDPACGTAGFLISAFKHILGKHQKNKPGDLMTPAERKKFMGNFAGYDISPDMVRIALVNMYLHGFPNPNIPEYDTLTSEEKWDELYDIILANPPFMSPKGGIRPHKRFSVQATRSEVLFVDYIMEHLTKDGRAGVIVPEGIIFQSQTAYKELRRKLVEENYLYAVVSLPAGVFNPYSNVKTSILLMDRKIARGRDDILFVKVENDGFDLGAQRKEIAKNDLLSALNVLVGISSKNKSELLIAHSAKKKTIIENRDSSLSGERYRDVAITSRTAFPHVYISDVCEINPGKENSVKLDPNLLVSFVPMATLSECNSDFCPDETKPVNTVIKGYTSFRDEDVLLAKITPCFENGKTGIARKLHNGLGFGSTEFIVLRPSIKILPELLYYYLKGCKFRDAGKLNMTGSGGQQRIPIDFVRNYKIPLPPLEIQQQIVAELSQYQKVIDGARMVVENYSSSLTVDASWPIVTLGDYIETQSGGTPSKANHSFWKGDIPWVSPKDMKCDFIGEAIDHVSVEAIKESATKLVKENTLLCVVRSGILKHSLPVAITTKPVCFNQDITAIIAKNNKLEIRYLFYYLKAHAKEILKDAIKPGVTVQSFHNGFFSSFKLPLPPVGIQKELVSHLEKEYFAVQSNKDLIDIFQHRINRKLSSIWGE